MKTLKLVLSAWFFLLIFVPLSSAGAKSFEFTAFGGQQFGGRFEYSDGKVNIFDSFNFSVILGYHVMPELLVEAYYSRQQDTGVEYQYDFVNVDRFLFNGSVEYILLGATYEITQGKAVTPFGSVMMGTSHMDPQPGQLRDAWLFTLSLGGGAKAFFTKNIGLRLDLRLHVPMKFSEGMLWYEPGSGFSYGASTSTFIVQGNAALGLVAIRIDT